MFRYSMRQQSGCRTDAAAESVVSVSFAAEAWLSAERVRGPISSLRTHGRALRARRDYDGAICAFEEARLRDPALDIAADLAAVGAAEPSSGRSRPPRAAPTTPTR